MADNVQIQGIEFEVVGVSEQAANGLKPLISSLKRLKQITANGLGLKNILQEIKDFNSGLGNGETPLSSLANAIGEISSSSRKLKSVYTNLEGISGLNFSNLSGAADAVQDIAQAASALKGFRRRAGNTSNLPALYGAQDSDTEDVGGETETGTVEDQFRATSAAADSMFSNLNRDAILSFNQIDMLIAKIEILKRKLSEGLPSNGGSMGDQEIANLALQIKQAEAQLNSLQRKAMENSSISKAFDNAKSAADALKSKLKELGKEFGKLALKGLKLGGSLIALPFKRLTSNIQKSIAPIKQFVSSIGRLAMYRLVRSAIAGITKSLTEGIKALYEYSKTAGTSFAKSMDSISASANKLKGSLASMAAPIIEALAPALNFLIEKVSALLSLIAQLFAALSGKGVFTKATKGASTFGSAAGGAAKEMRMLISGFDELNAFSKSGGGGGGGGGSGITFEEMPIAQEIMDFAKKLREAFEAGDWELLGKLLGDKVNEIFDSIDWAGIGKKLGRGIDGVIRTAYSFLKTVDFKKIGGHIATMLNNALAEINFETAGRLLVRKITALLDFVVGFINTLDWGLVAQSIGNFLKGAFLEAGEWLASTDFKELGRNVSDAVKKILDAILDAVKVIPWREVGEAIGDFLSNIDWPGVFLRVAKIIWEVIKGVFTSVFSHPANVLALGLFGLFKSLALVPLLFKAVAAYNALQFVRSVLNPIQGMPSQMVQTGQLMLPAGQSIVGALVKGIGMGAVGIGAAFWGIKDALMNGLNWLNGIIIPAGTALGGAGIGTIIGALGGPLGAGLGALIGLAVGLLVDAGIAIKEHWAEISGWITEKWTAFTGWASETWNTISNAMTTAFGAAVNWVSQAATDVGNWITGAWNTIKQHTSETWQNVKQMTIEEWNQAKAGVQQAVTDVGNWISTNWNNIKTWTSTTWNNVKTTITTTFTNAKNSVVQTANTLKQNLSNAWNNIKTTAANAWESVKNTAVNKWTTLSNTVSQKWQALKDALGRLDFTSIGRNLVEGLKNGVGGAWNSLVEKVRSLANGLINSIKGWFGVHSPSTVFAEIGVNLDAGLEQGIEWGTESLIDTANTIAGAVSNALTPDLPSVDSLTDSYGKMIGDTGLYLEQEEQANGDYGEEGNGYLAGIAQVVEQMFTYIRENNNQSQGDMKVVIDGREVFNVVVAENNRAIQRTGASPIRV